MREFTFKLPEDRKELKWLMGIYYAVVWCAGISCLMFINLIGRNPVLGVITILPYGAILYIHFKLAPMIREAWRKLRTREGNW